MLAKSNKRALKAAILAAWRNHAPSEFVQKSLPLRKKPSERRNLRSGDAVVLVKAERGLLAGLPRKDQNAIKAIVGKPIRFVSFDEDGRAELEFREKDGTIHLIYVRRDLVQTTRPGQKN